MKLHLALWLRCSATVGPAGRADTNRRGQRGAPRELQGLQVSV